jgi:Nif-specific regulatory protein
MPTQPKSEMTPVASSVARDIWRRSRQVAEAKAHSSGRWATLGVSDVAGDGPDEVDEPPVEDDPDCPIVGSSLRLREMFRLLRSVANSDATALIRGESGTGKELVAREIHRHSPRSDRPFICVNCGSLPENLVESELFGHKRGAFTGAHEDRKGCFELAEGGTLFLDEVGELPIGAQVKLLRALQEREVTPVGTGQSRRVDVRIVAATHVDLESAVCDGRFRSDLYYRINVFPIDVPPLRDRRVDVMPLAWHFVRQYTGQHRKCVTRISMPATQLLTRYHWPGNVRELENCMSRAVLLAHERVIRAHHLPPVLQVSRPAGGEARPSSLQDRLGAYERRLLMDALHDAGGNQALAAQLLDTTPRVLAYRLRKHGLDATTTTPRLRRER